MASRRRGRRGRPAEVVEDADDDVIISGQQSSNCIDLTADTSLEDSIIDLTNARGIIDNSPVVVLADVNEEGSSTSPPHRLGRGRSGARRRQTTPYSRSTRSQPLADLSDSDSDIELPDIPFPVPTQNVSSNATPRVTSNASTSSGLVQSPEGVSVSCPICLDDVKEIRKSKRQVMSTNCGHIFCEDCIKTAINTMRQCPSCRKKLTLKSIHPLFL